MSQFDVKFAAYERAMNANNNFGLKGDAVAEQYGRYTVGLQHDEAKAAKKKFGREYGKALAQERAELSKALTGQKNNTSLVPLNKRPSLPSMQEVLDRQFGKRQVIDLGYNYTEISSKPLLGNPAQVPNSAVFPSANAAEYGKMLAENPLPAKGQIVPLGGGAAQGIIAPQQEASEITNQNNNAGTKGNKKLSNAVINEKVETYRKAMEKQGLKGQQLEEQVARYKDGLVAERQKHFNKVKGKVKGKNIAKERAQGKLKVKPKNNGAFAKIGNFFKGKGGKAAAIAAGVVAIGAGLYALLRGCKDEKVEETSAKEQELLIATPPAEETVPAEETDTVTAVSADVETTEETAPAEVVPADGEATTETEPAEEAPAEEIPAEPAYQPIVNINEDGSYTTQKNDNFYKLAENLLKDYCKQNGVDKEITGFSPEVKQLAEKIMTDNNYWYDFSYTDARKRPSAPMLHPNVTLKLPEIKDFIEKKVDLAA